MSVDLYKVLGVARDADEEAVKKAFRKLARAHHPDRNPGKENEQRFKEISRANDVLSDAGKRSLYDEFGEESMALGFNPEVARLQRRYGIPDPYPKSAPPSTPAHDPAWVNHVVDSIFGNGSRQPRGVDVSTLVDEFVGATASSAAPRTVEITIDFAAAVTGTMVSLQMNERVLNVRIPPGVDTGTRLKISHAVVVVVNVRPHPAFQRDGLDLYLDVPVHIGEAYHGSEVQLATPFGTLAFRVPPRTQTGETLRLHGMGIARKGKETGDLYVKFIIQVPTQDDPDVARAVDVLAAKSGDVRRELRL